MLIDLLPKYFGVALFVGSDIIATIAMWGEFVRTGDRFVFVAATLASLCTLVMLAIIYSAVMFYF
jgi:hypothetical protein